MICNSGILCEEDINDCDPDPCYHGSQCVDGVDDYTCQCISGYEGTDCFMENETKKIVSTFKSDIFCFEICRSRSAGF